MPNASFSFAAAVDATPDGVVVLDRYGAIQYANPAFRRIVGSPQEALRGVLAWEVPGLGLDPQARSAVRRAVMAGQSLQVDVLTESRELEDLWHEIRLTPVTGTHGTVTQFVWIHREANLETRVQRELGRQTVRARAVADLLESYFSLSSFDDFLQAAVESVARVVSADFCEILWPRPSDERLRIRAFVGWRPESVEEVIVRPGMGSQTGYTLLTGKPEIVSEADQGARFFQPQIYKQHGVRSGVTVPLLLEGKAVGVLGAHCRTTRVFYPGEVQFLETTARIAMAAWQRSRADLEIEESQSQLGAIFRETSEGIYLVRVTGGGFVYELSNPALRTIMGMELEGRDPIAVWGEEAAGSVIESLRQVVDTATPQRSEGEFRLPAGRRRLAISRNPILGPDGRVDRIVGIVRDVTAEHEIQERLDIAYRMEALSRLAGGMAHRMNNVLTGIMGNVALIDARLRGADAVRSEIAGIEQGAREAAELVSQILKFARVQPALPTVFDLNDVLDRLRVVLTGRLPEHVTLTVQNAPEPVRVRADVGAIEQLLLNLTENAREAMPDGGRLFVSARTTDLDPEWAASLGVEAGSYVELEVSDTGVGIDPAIRQRIFEPFYTTKEVTGLAGLGLATAYGTVRQFGGSITVASGLGAGATFTIHLPRIITEAPPMQNDAPVTHAARGSESILVVEDEENVRTVTTQLLERLGYSVRSVASAREAIKIFEIVGDTVDLVLTDVVMPGMTGIEMADVLRELRPDVRILFTSGFPSKELGQVPEAPPHPFLPKPFSMEQLATVVRSVLDG